jgi:transcriptional regulator with PAS, ATPase and Fis domain
MSHRKIAILAIDDFIAEFFKNQLHMIFGTAIDVHTYTTEISQLPYIHDADLILYTDPSILIEFMDRIKSDCPVMIMKRTLSMEAVDLIRRIPPKSHCLVTNINNFMANETLATIYQLGFTNLSLHPYYEGCKTLPEKIDYIICHIDYDFLPKLDAEKVIIGSRLFDINTVLDILAVLNLDTHLTEETILRYSRRIPTMWTGLNRTLRNKRMLSSHWNTLIDELSMAIIVTDDRDLLTYVNSAAKEIFGGSIFDDTDNLKSLAEILPATALFTTPKDIDRELFVYEGRQLVLTVKHVMMGETRLGKLIFLENYLDLTSVHQKIHNKIVGKGYYSKHRFSSIYTANRKMQEYIQISKKIADSSAPALIFGESGTGKELMAGAIHNYSYRQKNPFVAINCATLPETLLESELFGYEEGAFTGAKKGGKIGLFESADGGTLFLDEIGEIPLKLQARLLRVIQEREIMRLGGDSIIQVNTRIIAATNKDLLQMVEDGLFRRDLFFRLNVFQIDLPPLRERPEDLPHLAQLFLKSHGADQMPLPLFSSFLQKYRWPGNIRELENLIEYMTTISDSHLSIRHLPGYLKKREHLEYPVAESGLSSDYLFVLSVIVELTNEGKRTGRRSITKTFGALYFTISEMEIRERLEFLTSANLITVAKGPAGCSLTEEGQRLYKSQFESPSIPL